MDLMENNLYIQSAYKDYKAFFNSLAQQTIDFCQSKGISYHIKSGTITP